MASRPLQPREFPQPAAIVTLRTSTPPGAVEARVLELETELEALRAKVATALAGLPPTDYMIMTLDAQGNVTSWNAAARRMSQSAGPEPSSRPGLLAGIGQVAPASLAVRPDWSFGVGRTGETWCPRSDGTRVRPHEILVLLLDADRRSQGSLRIVWEVPDQTRDDAAPTQPVRRRAKTPVRGVMLAVALSAPIYIGISLAIRWMLS